MNPPQTTATGAPCEGIPAVEPELASAMAQDLYDGGYYCSEAVVKVIRELHRHEVSDDVVRVATGFGAGLGRTQSVCGALAGAVMAVGLLAGRTHPGDDWRASTMVSRELLERFEEHYGSTVCAEVIEPFGGMGGSGRHEHCRGVVGTCAGWVHEIALREDW